MTPYHLSGFAAGLLVAAAAVSYGFQTPTNTLPATPEVQPELALVTNPKPQFPFAELSRSLGPNTASIIHDYYLEHTRQGLSHGEALCLAKDDHFSGIEFYETREDPWAESASARARMKQDAATAAERRQSCTAV